MTTVRRNIELCRDDPTPRNALRLEEACTELERRGRYVEEQYVLLMDQDPANSAAREREATTWIVDMTAVTDEIAQVLQQAAPAESPPSAAPPTSDKQYKPDLSLRPEKLSLSQQPSEFRRWCKAFKAYYNASAFDRVDIGNQHQQLCNNVDASIWERIEPKMTCETQMYGGTEANPDAMTLIEEAFLHAYPIRSRRVNLLAMSQKSGESATKWLLRVAAACREADVITMTADNFHCMIAMAGLRDGPMKTELLRLRNPSMDDLKVEALNQEQQRLEAKDGHLKLDRPNEFSISDAKQAAPYKKGGRDTARRGRGGGARGGRGGRGGQRSAPPRTTTMTCYNCGEQGHGSRECKRPRKPRDARTATHDEGSDAEQPRAIEYQPDTEVTDARTARGTPIATPPLTL